MELMRAVCEHILLNGCPKHYTKEINVEEEVKTMNKKTLMLNLYILGENLIAYFSESGNFNFVKKGNFNFAVTFLIFHL